MANTTQSEPTQFEDPHRHRVLSFWIIGGIVLVLLILGLILRRSNEKTQAAQAKATQLQQALTTAGIPAPSTDQIVNVLGEDGEVVCQNPKAAIGRAIQYGVSTSGAGGPGMRPVYTPRELVTGTEIVLSVYCPDRVPEFLENVEDLKMAHTIRERT